MTAITEHTKSTAITAPTNLIQPSQYVGSGVYDLTVLNEAESELTVSTEVTTNYTTATVPNTVGTTSVDQRQMTTTQYKTKIHSKTVDIKKFFITNISLTTSATLRTHLEYHILLSLIMNKEQQIHSCLQLLRRALRQW